MGLSSGSHNHVERRHPRQDATAQNLSQAPSQLIAVHLCSATEGNNQSHPWMAELVGAPPYLEIPGSVAVAALHDGPDIQGA